MSTSQLRDEKHAVQRALLSFEHKYGRPVSAIQFIHSSIQSLIPDVCVQYILCVYFLQQARPEKEIMRPIYDYYRDVKRLLSSHAARKNVSNINSWCVCKTIIIITCSSCVVCTCRD